jgi:hypothetical protein
MGYGNKRARGGLPSDRDANDTSCRNVLHEGLAHPSGDDAVTHTDDRALPRWNDDDAPEDQIPLGLRAAQVVNRVNPNAPDDSNPSRIGRDGQAFVDVARGKAGAVDRRRIVGLGGR